MKWMLLFIWMNLSCATLTKSEASMPQCLIDPVIVSPQMYRVIRETPKVREIRLYARAGQSDRAHGHYRGRWTVLQGGKGRLYDAAGAFRDVELKAGMSGEQARTILHRFENRGDTPIEVQMIETKSDEIQWCPR